MSVTSIASEAPTSTLSITAIAPHKKAAALLRCAMRLTAPVLRVACRVLFELRMRRAVGELAGLDDRMLRDIGLNRNSLEYAVRCNATTGRFPSGRNGFG